MKRYFIKTWGCQMNDHDSEKISGVLSSMGYAPSAALSDADVILLNTCSVREKSFQKAFAFLGRLKKMKEENPSLIIGFCGCVAQQEGSRIFERAPHVNFIMGPRSLGSIEKLIDQSSSSSICLDPLWKDDFSMIRFESFVRKTFPKAYITIMEGCNRGCSYCIVPQTRGREACRPFQEIIREAIFLSESGFLEIELLGQNVNGYRFEDKTFVDLLRGLLKIHSLKRIRFTTSHPSHLSLEIMREMKENDRMCNHVHLPVQSGSDRILKLMNRGYTARDYIEKVFWLKENIKDFTLSTDIIVGFPGEDDSDFKDTISLIEKIEFQNIYSFAYSPRPGTPAAKLNDNVPHSVKLERLHSLQNLQTSIQEQANREWIGRDVQVLYDGKSKKDNNMLSGRTKNNKIVNFYCREPLKDRIVTVKIKDSSVHCLIGELILS
ncbi:MAG: tRNA (N6-isopentenyl adenosine(37)-C2)-methylthiotransferase MiaB [Acidobacteriota bacterium]